MFTPFYNFERLFLRNVYTKRHGVLFCKTVMLIFSVVMASTLKPHTFIRRDPMELTEGRKQGRFIKCSLYTSREFPDES